MPVATATSLSCPSQESFHVLEELLVLPECCSFRFANEKQGEEGRHLLRDAFSNLPYQPGREMRCPCWQPSAVPGAQRGAARRPVGLCMGREVTRRVDFGASTEGTGLAVLHDVHRV